MASKQKKPVPHRGVARMNVVKAQARDVARENSKFAELELALERRGMKP